MSFEIVVTIVLAFLSVALAVIGSLLKIIYSALTSRMDRRDEENNERFRSLIHADRDVRNQLQGITKLFFESLRKNGE